MSILVLQLPDLDVSSDSRPRHCPYCGSSILQRWGQVSKAIRDPDHQVTEIHRYRCCDCERTFRDYPDGVDRSNRSLRIRQLAALAWALGLSCREVVSVFRELGIHLSRMTVWRDGQELVARLNGEDLADFTPEFSLDRVYLQKNVPGFGVTVAINVGNRRTVILGNLDEHNPRAIKSWLEPIIQDMDLRVVMMGTGALDPARLPGSGGLYLPPH